MKKFILMGFAAALFYLPVPADDVPALLEAVRDHGIDLTIVGPEAPLVAGVVDRFRAEGLAIFGPTQAAARIESSKAFAKELMAKAGVPTAAFRVFDDHAAAADYVRSHGAPIVVKADGLAAGKGVVVAETVDEALEALDAMMVRRAFGEAGSRVVLEECLLGQEVSVFCFTDGTLVSSLVAACDYKRVGDGDTGPNTGGMGGYSPPPFWTPELAERIRDEVMVPTVRALAEAGTPYTGVLYGGVVLTGDGPKALEFNARFGDPEAQLVLSRLENDLLDVVEAVVSGDFAALELHWTADACVGVVVASAGYPGAYETGKAVVGLDALPDDVVAFQAGTAAKEGATVTSGGRVLTVVGRGSDLASARQRAYAGVAAVHFDGAFHRGDIAGFAVAG